MKNYILASLLLLLLTSCVTKNHYVLTATGTVIGVSIAQNPATQMYEAKLGYNRAELVLTPTNGIDVIMEIKYGSIFNLTSGGIYQRLAIGKTAVSQPGAAAMFARDAKGNFNPTNAAAFYNLMRTTAKPNE